MSEGSRLRGILGAALAGAALGACVLGWLVSWCGPGEVSAGPLLGVALGLAVGLARPLPLATAWLPLGAILIALLRAGPVALPGGPLVGGALLAACGAGAGSLLKRALSGAVGRMACGTCGALSVVLAVSASGSGLWLLAAGGLLATVSAALLRDHRAPSATPAEGLEATLTGVAALRLGVCFLVTAAALAFEEGPLKGSAAGPLRGALQASVPALLGLLAGLGLGALLSILEGRWVAWICEPLGWALTVTLAARSPQWLAGGGGTLWLAAGAGTALSGVSLSGPLRRGGGWGLALIVLALPLADPVLELGAERWSTVDRLSLGMGQHGSVDAELRKAVESGDARVRFASPGPGAVDVVDVRVGRQGTVRLLTLDGDVRAGVPTRRDGSPEALVAPILQAALPLLLAPEPPRRVAVLGLDAGVTCGALLRASLEEVAVVEPSAGVVRAHRDPGDLFGYINNRPLADPRLTLHQVATAGFLRGAPRGRWDVIVASRPPLAPPFPELVASRGALVCWGTQEASQAQLASLPGRVWVFAPGDGGLVILAGQGLQVSVPRVRARLDLEPRLRAELGRVGLDDPIALLSTLVAGPDTVARLVPSADPLTLLELAGAGAAALPAALTLSDDERQAAASLAALAERLALRRSEGALPMARAAVERRRGGTTLRVLGDVLRSLGQNQAAVAAWTESLELDEDSVSTRLSLANWHLEQSAWKAGLTVLLPAVGLDPARDAQVHYHLGRLALGAKEFKLARRHLRKAEGFRNAADLLLLAERLAGPMVAGKLPPRQKLAAAELFAAKARSATTEAEAARLWDDAVAAALPLAHDPSALSRREQLRLARVLERCRGSRDPVARRLLSGLEVEVLELHAGDPAVDRRRARALAYAGRGEEGERLLAGIVTQGGRQAALAQRALGDVLEVQGKLEAAVTAWERYLDMTSASSAQAKVYLEIADAERRRGRREQAVRSLQAAERVQPGHPEVRLNLGTLLLELGREREGIEAYRGFLDVAPLHHPMLGRVRARVAQSLDR